VKVDSSEKGRSLVFRAAAGETLPDALVKVLEDEAVACGWMRASGVLEDVELRAFRSDRGELGATRRLEGAVQVISLEGSIGLADQLSTGIQIRPSQQADIRTVLPGHQRVLNDRRRRGDSGIAGEGYFCEQRAAQS